MNPHDVLRARRPIDLFGELPEGEELTALRRIFRRLARRVHPDQNPDSGDTVFAHLGNLYERALEQVEDGTYGEDLVTRIEHGGRTYRLRNGPVFFGTVSRFFEGDMDGEPVLAKVGRRTPTARKLLEHEARVLEQVTHAEWPAYFPALIESFTIGRQRDRRVVSVFKQTDTLYPLTAVRERYPDGVHPKDLVWMLRRLLFVLGLVHEAGYVHGAVLPQHILIEPEKHGVVLLDWKHATAIGDRLESIPRGERFSYPPEVIDDRGPVGPGTDLWLAAGSMFFAAGDDWQQHLPEPLRSFLRACRLRPRRTRPQSAHALLARLDELIGRLWGPRKFHPFTM